MEQSLSDVDVFSARQEIPRILWNLEPEGSLSHSEEPATCPYSEPDQSSPCPRPTSLRSILILYSYLRLCDRHTEVYIVQVVSYFQSSLKAILCIFQEHRGEPGK